MATASMASYVLTNLTWQVIRSEDRDGKRWWLQGCHPSGGHCCFIDLQQALEVAVYDPDQD